MKNIYLVGFMGTGKTTVGRAVASRASLVFVDLDELIEQKAAMPITEIFSRHGEAYFRQRETEALTEVSRSDDRIVACGGGIVTQPENIRIMKETGTMICLAASSQTILERTRKCAHRPLLNVDNPRERIESLLKSRAACYAQADTTIDTTGLTIAEAVAKVMGCITR